MYKKELQKDQKKKTHPVPQQLVRRRKLFGIIIVGVIILLAFVAIFLFFSRSKNPHITAEKKISTDMIGDSKYADTRSRFVTQETTTSHLHAEYPITGTKQIDATIAATIDSDRAHYSSDTTSRQPALHTTFTFNSSYQVPYADTTYFSIVVSTNYDAQLAHPVALSHSWTFNRKTGAVIESSALFKDSAGMPALLAAVQTSVIQQDNKQGGVMDSSSVGDFISTDTIRNFTILDRKYIRFYFGRGDVAPESDGTMIVSIPATTMQNYLKPDLAKTIFDLTAPLPPQQTTSTPAKGDSDCPAKCVALTFDDGPGAYTDQLLDILSSNHVGATFFVIGQSVASHPTLVKREVSLGYDVGNHTRDHPQLTQLSIPQIDSELAQTNQAITSAGLTPILMRPPYGAANTAVYQEAAKYNLAAIHWSVDTRDWADRNSSIVCNRAVAGAGPGAIILMHDIHPTTVNAVPCIIKGISAAGYKMVTISQLLGHPSPGKVYYSASS